ncbi:hypothetical protein ACSQ6I_08950 [Anabaena sp. WFMT]|uniref:hypothetical protein n=1 Tax=Anabaena sp. WFMT TaxID=3449730 RepID=UPI003F25A6FC
MSATIISFTGNVKIRKPPKAPVKFIAPRKLKFGELLVIQSGSAKVICDANPLEVKEVSDDDQYSLSSFCGAVPPNNEKANDLIVKLGTIQWELAEIKLQQGEIKEAKTLLENAAKNFAQIEDEETVNFLNQKIMEL